MRFILVCTGHAQRQTPLISTMAFRGAEYWCPYCGGNTSMMGGGKNVPLTSALRTTAVADKVISKDYLRAIAAQSCTKLKYNGEWIEPSKLPPEEKARLAKAITDWKYEGATA